MTGNRRKMTASNISAQRHRCASATRAFPSISRASSAAGFRTLRIERLRGRSGVAADNGGDGGVDENEKSGRGGAAACGLISAYAYRSRITMA